MLRSARIVGPGFPHHIIQRGNNRDRVFLKKENYEKCISLLETYSEKKETSILAYCLMPNHVHLLVKPSENDGLAKMMQGITLCYTQYFNKKNQRTGRLWESRCYSTVVDEERYLWAVCRCIENNPLRTRIVGKPEAYPYSSAKAHILGEKDSLLREALFDKSELGEYKKFMKIDEDKRLQEEIRHQARSGMPLGDGGFLKTLSERLGCDLYFRPRGRPRKE